jgi:hypothetical protein
LDQHFGEISVSDQSNVNTLNSTYSGCIYTNNTELDGTIIFTGSRWFQFKEIEIFEITGNDLLVPSFPNAPPLPSLLAVPAIPFASSINSPIISDFPKIFTELRMKHFHFCGGAVEMVSVQKKFTSDVMVMETL